jgi:ribosomal protein S18
MPGNSEEQAKIPTNRKLVLTHYNHINAMRKELELIQLIENYLKGNLSEADTQAFEKRMSTDKELQKEVQLQSDLMKGIERAGIKQSAGNAFKKYNFNRNLKNWGLGGLTIAIIALSCVLMYTSLQHPKENAAQPLPELNEQGEKFWSDADKYLPLQNFELNTEKDTVVETADGIVIAIPAHSFLTAGGQPATGTISLEVKEALDASDIMKAGLNTKSGDQLLETGGMFYINVRKDGASLKIDPKNGLRAQIPTNEVKPGMQLFEGKRMPDGSIDWVNPKPVAKDLIPVDILSLNFYPPDYLDSLRSWGYNDKDKKFTDSLYYSFAAHSNPATQLSLAQQVRDVTSSEADTVLKGSNSDLDIYDGEIAGINPAKIKAIWDTHFQNTLLSTKEFEERLSAIHKTCEERILDMYINNLDKNLCTIDSLVALTDFGYDSFLPSQFKKFAARGDGKVKNGDQNVELLKKYYQEKSKIYTEAITKTRNEFWKKQRELDQEATEKNGQHTIQDYKRISDNYAVELETNLKEAFRQLGVTPTIPPPATYGVTITSVGWKNIDRFNIIQAVATSVLTRTNLNFIDSATGKKAVINYNPVNVRVNNYKNYDRVLVYLLPDEFNSFMRVKNKSEVFEEKVTNLMTYKLVCIAYKGEESFYYSQDNVKPGSFNVSLIRTTNADIQDNVNKFGKMNQVKAMNDELKYEAFKKQEEKRQTQLVRLKELTDKTRAVIFPCMVVQNDSTARPADAVSFK